MPNIPCKNCISFAICNGKIYKFKGVYKTQFVLSKLGTCELFSEWAMKDEYKYFYSFQMSLDQMEEACEVFNMKLDIHPDYNLQRHLKGYKNGRNNTMKSVHNICTVYG